MAALGTANATPYIRQNGPVPEAVSLLSKMLSWHDFEGDTVDGWGAFPLLKDASGVTYAAASTGGTGPVGQCFSAGRVRMPISFPVIASNHVTQFAMLSTAVFNASAIVAGLYSPVDITQPGATHLVEAAEGWRGESALAAGYGSAGIVSGPGSQGINTWHLVGYTAIDSGTAYIHHDGTHRYASGALSGVLAGTGVITIGTVAGAGTDSMIAFSGTLSGEPTAAEWKYLYNAGTGRTLAMILADAKYERPTVRYGGTGTDTNQSTSYNGKVIARNTAVANDSSYNFCNTFRSSGLYWDAFLIQRLGTTAWVSSAGYQTASLADVSWVGFSHLNNVSVAGNITTGTNPNISASVAGDIIMRAINFTSKKIWYGKNGVWSGDPVAGTGHAATFTNALSLAPMFYMRDEFSIKNYLKTGEMPYANPTGFTPWGDA